jgi:hypothetical protein
MEGNMSNEVQVTDEQLRQMCLSVCDNVRRVVDVVELVDERTCATEDSALMTAHEIFERCAKQAFDGLQEIEGQLARRERPQTIAAKVARRSRKVRK